MHISKVYIHWQHNFQKVYTMWEFLEMRDHVGILYPEDKLRKHNWHELFIHAQKWKQASEESCIKGCIYSSA